MSVTTYGMYVGLLLLFPPGVAFGVSYLLGLAFNYLVSSTWIFRSKLSLSRVLPFTAMHILIVIVGVLGVSLAVESLQISEFFAPFVVLPLTSALSFILQRQIFKERQRPTSVQSPGS